MANCIRCGRQLPPLTFGKKICQWCVQHEAAQRGEDTDDAKQVVLPAPWVRREAGISVTQVLFGANLAVFIAMVLASGSADFPGKILVHFGANYGPLTLSGDWWRLLTYMFLHGGLMHIAFNMWCLWDLGKLCESLYGRWTFVAVYVLTGIAGGLASVGWNPGVLSVGASGAIFGLAGALIASFYLGEFSLPRIAIQGTLRSLVFFVGFNVLFGSLFPGIDNACHAGGLISGLALGALIARLAPQSDATIRRVGVIGVVALALLGAGFGVRQWRGGPMRMARVFESLGEHGGDSVARLQAVVREQPNSVEAHFELAQVYYSRQQFAQAESEFKRVIELQPQNAGARFDLGMTYLIERRFDDAKSAFTQMFAQDANSAEAHYGLGLVLYDQENYQGAIEEFKVAAAANLQFSGFYYEMGSSYAKLKMYDEAIAAYLKEKEKSGDDPDLENALADAYQAKGMTQQAQEARTKAGQAKGGGSDH
jgi:membrane associated rhomboid family serine protease/Flp pilus assembly protein TadD